jgi:pimeloyl-ACP methyl ester carboxylesterase
MATTNQTSIFRHFQKTDALAAAQLATQTTSDIIDVTEQIHLSVIQQLTNSQRLPVRLLESGTRTVYKGIRILPNASNLFLKPIAGFIHQRNTEIAAVDEAEETVERLNMLAALNGVFGDQFEATHNPITTIMKLIFAKEQYCKKTLFIHVLCMDERAWSHVCTEALGNETQSDVWKLRYNTGLSIEENGKQLSQKLERTLVSPDHKGASLKKDNDDESIRLNLIGHSMGGLIAVAALLHAQQHNLQWHHSVNKLITLGTPFNGAPLASWGHWVDERLSLIQITKPFTMLTKRRSMGIQNLREGLKHAETDQLTLPVYCIAGTLPTGQLGTVNKALGDGLVTKESAFGLVHIKQRWVAENIGHLKLLKAPEVFKKMESWLSE